MWGKMVLPAQSSKPPNGSRQLREITFGWEKTVQLIKSSSDVPRESWSVIRALSLLRRPSATGSV